MKKNDRQEKKKATRQLLLSINYQEFAMKGIQATTTLQVAKAASLAHGTVFAHFKTREELLLAVLEQFSMKLGERLEALTSQKLGFQELLLAHLAILKEDECF